MAVATAALCSPKSCFSICTAADAVAATDELSFAAESSAASPAFHVLFFCHEARTKVGVRSAPRDRCLLELRTTGHISSSIHLEIVDSTWLASQRAQRIPQKERLYRLTCVFTKTERNSEEGMHEHAYIVEL